MTTNIETRALVSALRCGLVDLRAVACELIDAASHGDSDWPRVNVQHAFGCSRNTARTLLRERAKFDTLGRRK